MSAGPLILSGAFGLMVGFVVMGFVLARQAYRRERERRIEAETVSANARAEAAAAKAETERVTEQRNFAMDQLHAMRAAFTEQENRLRNLERVARNPLYADSIEDVQAANVQAAVRLRMVIEEATIAQEILSKQESLGRRKGKGKK